MDRTAAPAPFWETRPLAALAIGAGIGARLGIAWELPGIGLAAICAAILLLVTTFVLNRKAFLCLWLAFALAGLGWGSYYAHPHRPEEGTYVIALTIDGQVRQREDGQISCYVKDVILNGEPAGNAYWSFYLKQDEVLWPMDDGDRVTLSGRVYHPGGQENPYGFDFEEYLLMKGCTVGIYGRDELQVEQHAPLTAYRLRETLAAYLEGLMPGESGLAQALVLGDRYDMTEEDREAFQVLGVAHVLAVSGLHVSILYALAMVLMRGVSLRIRSWVAALVLVGYGWLAGFSPSIVRAVILSLAGLAGRTLWRSSDGLTSLGLAFMALIVINPMNLVNDGFVMSFAAVLGILLLYGPIAGRLDFLPRWLRSSLAISLAAQLGVAVPVMACYQEMALLSLVLNLAVIPLTTGLMVLYLTVMILGWTPLGLWLGQGAAWITRLYLDGIGMLARIPFASVSTGTPGWPVWVGALLLLVCFSHYVVWRRGARALAALLGVILCLVGWPPREMPPTYMQFSLGQADSAVIMEGSHTLLVDTGESGSDVADYLKAVNRSVDALFISHLHLDHVGGLEDLLAAEIDIGACYISQDADVADVSQTALELMDQLAGLGVPVIELSAGEVLTLGDIQVEVLAPAQPARPGQEPNETSLCLLIDLAGARILTVGDLPTKLEKMAAVPADVLKVAHHGSAQCTDAEFLADVHPRLALITCSSGKSLPNPKTLQRLEDSGADIYRTDESGAITLAVTPEGIQVESFLNKGDMHEPYPVFSSR